MALYFFNIFNGTDVFDTTGTDLDSITDARLYMLTIAKMWIEQEKHHGPPWHIEVRDDYENLVGSMKFGTLAENA